MTPHTRHTARFAGRCASCSDTIIRGDTVLTIHGTRRRTLCPECSRLWLARQAGADNASREAYALAARDPKD